MSRVLIPDLSFPDNFYKKVSVVKNCHFFIVIYYINGCIFIKLSIGVIAMQKVIDKLNTDSDAFKKASLKVNNSKERSSKDYLDYFDIFKGIDRICRRVDKLVDIEGLVEIHSNELKIIRDIKNTSKRKHDWNLIKKDVMLYNDIKFTIDKASRTYFNYSAREDTSYINETVTRNVERMVDKLDLSYLSIEEIMVLSVNVESRIVANRLLFKIENLVGLAGLNDLIIKLIDIGGSLYIGNSAKSYVYDRHFVKGVCLDYTNYVKSNELEIVSLFSLIRLFNNNILSDIILNFSEEELIENDEFALYMINDYFRTNGNSSYSVRYYIGKRINSVNMVNNFLKLLGKDDFILLIDSILGKTASSRGFINFASMINSIRLVSPDIFNSIREKIADNAKDHLHRTIEMDVYLAAPDKFIENTLSREKGSRIVNDVNSYLRNKGDLFKSFNFKYDVKPFSLVLEELGKLAESHDKLFQ
jgi:hypothetical protein